MFRGNGKLNAPFTLAGFAYLPSIMLGYRR